MYKDDIELKVSTKHLPLEYGLIEWRLMINRELYEEKVIDLKVYGMMESQLLGRLEKIKNEYQDVYDDLTIVNNHGSMASS